MFDGVVMDVIDMPSQIILVPDLVFPIASLPDAALAFGDWRENPALIYDQRNG